MRLIKSALSGDAQRLFAVSEFLLHLEQSQPLIDALRASNQLDDAWTLTAAYAARTIERRMKLIGGHGRGHARPAPGDGGRRQ